VISQTEIIQRLIVATILGGMVGMERERLERAAGLRTHALVGVGSALFMVVSAFGFGDIVSAQHVSLDPSRIAAQVVSGIGFLGAGTIIFQREIVRGLTTAASIWAVAAIGLAVGGGLYLAAVAATAVVLLVLAGLKPIENRFFLRRRSRVIRLVVGHNPRVLTDVEVAVESAGLRLERLIIDRGADGEGDRVDVTVNHGSTQSLNALLDRLRATDGVWQIISTRLPAEEPASGPGTKDDDDGDHYR
jgi:putative Mg2+ transporter-C (MgtC) family protein